MCLGATTHQLFVTAWFNWEPSLLTRSFDFWLKGKCRRHSTIYVFVSDSLVATTSSLSAQHAHLYHTHTHRLFKERKVTRLSDRRRFRPFNVSPYYFFSSLFSISISFKNKSFIILCSHISDDQVLKWRLTRLHGTEFNGYESKKKKTTDRYKREKRCAYLFCNRLIWTNTKLFFFSLQKTKNLTFNSTSIFPIIAFAIFHRSGFRYWIWLFFTLLSAVEHDGDVIQSRLKIHHVDSLDMSTEQASCQYGGGEEEWWWYKKGCAFTNSSAVAG